MAQTTKEQNKIEKQLKLKKKENLKNKTFFKKLVDNLRAFLAILERVNFKNFLQQWWTI